MINSDAAWFREHRDRDYHIRLPAKGEFTAEWRYIGPHDADRRRVMIWRIPKNNPGRRAVPDGLMRVPFLAFSDETIEDTDAVLKPIMDGIMKEAAG